MSSLLPLRLYLFEEKLINENLLPGARNKTREII